MMKVPRGLKNLDLLSSLASTPADVQFLAISHAYSELPLTLLFISPFENSDFFWYAKF